MAGVSATATSSLVTAKVRYQAVAILASTADTHAMQPLTALGDSLPFPRREAQPYLTGSVRRAGTLSSLNYSSPARRRPSIYLERSSVRTIG